MKIKYNLNMAYTALEANRFRTFLTVLGIVIGITAIMVVLSLGSGAQDLIMGEFRGFGPKLIIITPGGQPESPTAFASEFLVTSLKERELKALQKKENVPNAAKILPINVGTVIGSREGVIYRFIVYGTTDYITQLYDIYPERGAFFNEEDVQNRASVIVIGSKLKNELFGQDEALGRTMKVNGQNFRVVGVLPPKGSGSLIGFDEQGIIPYTTAQLYLLGTKHFQHIILEADSETHIPAVVQDAKTTLRNLHNITDPKKDDFYIETQEDIVKQVATVTDVLTYFLAAVAGISLLVGGVGIMNIMLVSVTERTREIGLRKALGATTANILTQFLLESALLTVIGGVIGIALGGGLSFLSSILLKHFLALDWPFVFPVSAMLMGLGMASLVGFVFGLYPARQASQKSPIEALRYE